jgi:hypothetical protein
MWGIAAASRYRGEITDSRNAGATRFRGEGIAPRNTFGEMNISFQSMNRYAGAGGWSAARAIETAPEAKYGPSAGCYCKTVEARFRRLHGFSKKHKPG